MRSTISAFALLLTSFLVAPVSGQDTGAAAVSSPDELLRTFQEGWDEELWQQKFRGKAGYMRADDDRGWQLRMLTLQRLVKHGQKSVPVLLKSLKSGSTPERILAAQALGYLGPQVAFEPLIEAAKSDADPLVRVYAIDSLGMLGCDEQSVDWKALQKAETNRDTRKHINYAIERGGKRIDPTVAAQLTDWDVTTMSSARLGKPAPDFTLNAATGETVRLSNFKGKKAVVLVFIYGDT